MWWNRGWAPPFGDPASVAPRLRNFARSKFPAGSEPAQLALWPVIESEPEAVERAVVADLRRATGRFPKDSRLAALIAELNAGNARFAELWASGVVGAHREDHK